MVSMDIIKEQTLKCIYWETPVISVSVLTSILTLLVSVCYLSLISVCAYLSLVVLAMVLAVRLYFYIMVLLNKTTPGSNPLNMITSIDVNIPPEKVVNISGILVDILNPAMMELRRLFLLENWFDTIKFVLSLWCLTYIGSWFNMMTLIILTWIGFFTIPLVYKNNQATIDEVVSTANNQINDIKEKINSVIPLKNKGVLKKEE